MSPADLVLKIKEKFAARYSRAGGVAKYAQGINPATGKPWDESKHPREAGGEKGGQFTSGSGGGGGGGAAGGGGKPVAARIDPKEQKPPVGNDPLDARNMPGKFVSPNENRPPSVARDGFDQSAVAGADQMIAAIGTPTPETIQQYMAAVEQHPYYLEANRRISEAAAQTKSGNPTLWSKEKHTGPDGNYTPERQAVHQQILSKMLNPNATKKRSASGKPVVVLLMGPPGAGKTTAGQPAISGLGFDPKTDFTVVNADDVKAALPEYRGWNAGLVHEESSELAEGPLTQQAMQAQHNMIMDLTGANGDKMAQMVDNFAKAGYEAHMIQVTVPPAKIAQRVWDRFRGNAFGNKDLNAEHGRFVPPKYAFSHVDSKPDKSYETLKQHPAMQSWSKISTDVPRGTEPTLIDAGKRGGYEQKDTDKYPLYEPPAV